MKALVKKVIIAAGAAIFLSLGTAMAFAGEPNPAPNGDEGNGNSFTTPGFTFEVVQPRDDDDPEEYVVPPDEQVFPDDGEIVPATAADDPAGALPGADAAGAGDVADTGDEADAADQNLAGADATGNSGSVDFADDTAGGHLDLQSADDGGQTQSTNGTQNKLNPGSGSDSVPVNQKPSTGSSMGNSGPAMNGFTLALLVIVAALAVSMTLAGRRLTSRLRHS